MPSNETKSDLTTSSKAPKSDENDYEQRSKDLSESLVHDFLYHDARRIASFLSQFETYGVVQLIKATETTSRASATKTAITAGGGLPLVAKGEATRDHIPSARSLTYIDAKAKVAKKQAAEERRRAWRAKQPRIGFHNVR